MVNAARELAKIIQILLDASSSLASHARALTERLLNALPTDEPPARLTASVRGVTGSTMTVELVWDNSGTGNHVTIDWGVPDVTDDDEPAVGTATYQYAAIGSYVVSVTDLVDATRATSVDVTIPFVNGG